jgi:cell volume regulation protein A
VQTGDYVYLLAPPEKARALDRFFVNMPPPAKPDPHLLGDFFVTGDHTLGELAEIYGLKLSPDAASTTLADYFASELKHPPRLGEVLALGPIVLVAYKVAENRVTSVGLRLPEEDEPPPTWWGRLKTIVRRLSAWIG